MGGYRREIDGLRAIAVVPVILFHAGLNIFGGGFVGVDIFFVISGYLITGILIDELDRGDFSIVRFYERRARRILPALFFVILCCFPFALTWMPPSDFAAFSRSAVAVTLFASNILFWREQDYFASAAELKPLLHTWSLAVEEQYYLFFPLLMMISWRFGRRKSFWMIVAIASISLLASEWGWRNQPSANFYLAFTRAWELMAGSICAFVIRGRQLAPSNWLSMAGMVLILLAIFTFDEETPFPSLYALVPVSGTALVILFASSGTWIERLLSWNIFVSIGLVSYSAYLWHQPLFAFARIRSLHEPGLTFMLGLAAASLALAYLSWRFVEQPFRNRRAPLLPTRRRLFGTSATIAAGIAALGLAGHIGQGFPQRFDPSVLEIAKAADDKAPMTCFSDERWPLPTHPRPGCLHPDKAGATSILFIGDSHALAVSDAMAQDLRTSDIGYYFTFYGSCVPLAGFRRMEAPANHRCSQFNHDAIEYARSIDVRTVVLMARFPLYLTGERYDNGEGGLEAGERVFADTGGHRSSTWDDPSRRSRVLQAYEGRIRELAAEFNVVLVDPVPEAGWNVPQYAFKRAAFENGKRGEVISTPFMRYKERSREVTDLFDRLSVELHSVHRARVQEAFCSEETNRCTNADSAGIYYYDDDHLSNAGARRAAPIIRQTIEVADKRK